jgi:hypothetical protein
MTPPTREEVKVKDIQQCLAGFKTVAVIGGPLIVRVHKALDVIYAESSKHGYFISVDFKFKRNDALYIGQPGYEGLSKTEATREANLLSKRIADCHRAMTGAKELALNWDTVTNRITASRQEERFNAVVGKYGAEFEQP